MASRAAIGEGTALADKVKLPIVLLIAAVTLGVCLGLGAMGGLLYLLTKSGRLPLGAVLQGSVAASVGDGPAHRIVLQPILVNLADEGGHAYLRLGLTLDVVGEDAKRRSGPDSSGNASETEQEVVVRDTVLGVLSRQTSAWLLGPDGREHLKIELREALARCNAPVKVKAVFFTDFLVQI